MKTVNKINKCVNQLIIPIEGWRNRTQICKSCGHQIVKRNDGVWVHYFVPELECPINENIRGECGYTLKGCADKYFPPCSYYHVESTVCICSCKKSIPEHFLVHLVRIAVCFKNENKYL